MSFIFSLLPLYSLIGVLLLGYLDDSATEEDEDESRSYMPTNAKANDAFALPVARPPRAVPPMLPPDNDEEADVDPL